MKYTILLLFMNYHLLTDHQLTLLYKNHSLNKFIRKGIKNEITKRRILLPVSLSNRRTLPRSYKMALIICPFLITFFLSFSALSTLLKGRLPVKSSRQLLILILLNAVVIYRINKFLLAGEYKKWQEFWLYFCYGIILWTIISIVLTRLYFAT